MKKPENYKLKKWLCENIIVGLHIHYYQTGTESADTDWELITGEGKSKRINANLIKHLVNVKPDWASVLRVNNEIIKEVNEYKIFAKKEAKDLVEYERLKKKFE